MVDNRRRYKVIETLGKGGFGTVYLAEMLGQGGFSKQVALKLLNKSSDNDEEITLRFRDEARILGLIDHRAVVKVDSLTQLDQGWAVVMEYVHGVNVSALVKAPIPPRCAFEVAEEVASALHAAFSVPNAMTKEPLGLVHRDIKPANIRVTPQGTVKVLDFGVARANFNEREALTTQMRFGSLRYMAPERLDDIDGHTGDIFALGLVLAELLGARRYPEPPKGEKRYGPFLKGVLHFVRTNLTQGPFPVEDPDHINRAVAVVEACLQFDHEARPNAKAIEREFRDLAKSMGGPWLRDWCESEIPTLMSLRTIEHVATDSVLIESTGTYNLTGLSTDTHTINLKTKNRLVWLLALGGAALVLAALVLFAGAMMLLQQPDEPIHGVLPPLAVETHPSPPPPEPAPAPEPAPEPVVEPTPMPAATPIPPPKPKPKPKAKAKGARVKWGGDAKRVVLQGAAGQFVLGGSRKTVPAGTYKVLATFEDSDPMVVMTLKLQTGETANIFCQSLLMNCVKQ